MHLWLPAAVLNELAAPRRPQGLRKFGNALHQAFVAWSDGRHLVSCHCRHDSFVAWRMEESAARFQPVLLPRTVCRAA